jgi:hypothetical protein
MSLAATDGSAEPEPIVRGLVRHPGGAPLAVPSDGQFQAMLAGANDAESLQEIRQAFVALEAVASKCKMAFGELVRLAVQRLEVERKLGAFLAQTVHQGRPAKRSPEATISPGATLPDKVTKQEAAKYRQLAAIPEVVFQQYLEAASASGKLPTSAGARRFGNAGTPKAKRTRLSKGRATDSVVLHRVLDALSRIMELPDVHVGSEKVRARMTLPPRAPNVVAKLAGDVFVAECDDPVSLLAELRRRRDSGKVAQAVVLLSAEVWAPWFAELQGHGWTICYLQNAQVSGTGRIVAHLGARASAFRIAFGSLGPVFGFDR